MNNVNLDPKQEVVDGTLDQVFSLEFTKRDWIVIFNTMLEKQWPLGAARLALPIAEKIEPIVANKEAK